LRLGTVVNDSPNTDGANPYASPRGLSAGHESDPGRVLTATFIIDEAWQRVATDALTRWQMRLNDSVFIVVLLAGAVSGPLVFAEEPTWIGRAIIGLCKGIFLGLAGCMVLAFVSGHLMSMWNRRFRPTTYPSGFGRILIDAKALTLECGVESHVFPLVVVRQNCLTEIAWFRIVGFDDRFHVPASADFGDEAFASWKKEVRKRIKAD
jgi:hypothetical protein